MRASFLAYMASEAFAPSVELSADRPNGNVNIASGDVIGVSHLGEMLQFLVQLDEQTAVLSRRPTPDAPALSVGDRVWATWRPDAVQVFPAGDAAARSGYVPPPTAAQISDP